VAAVISVGVYAEIGLRTDQFMALLLGMLFCDL
jgi:hypothetical protein